jgi:filamentous hemagglutinin
MNTKNSGPNCALTPIAYAIAMAFLSLSPGYLQAQVGVKLPSGATIVQGANAPVVNGTKMTIEQVAPRAIINWNSFNIGAGNRVEFNQQGRADWAVLNRVVGNERSVINGVLQADGQVFLLNNNGILIGKGAQVNVHTFLASTLTMADKVFNDGILSLEGKLPVLTAGTGDFSPRGNIIIEAGAIVVAKDGGRLSFFASGQVFDANGQPMLDVDGKPVGLVENNGRLLASNGQVIVAAGDKVYLRQTSATVAREDGFSGLVVEVDSGGKVANGLLGFIQSKLGNISMVGLTVNQEGRVSATTSVNRNGSIWLMARDTTIFGPTGDEGARPPTRGGSLTLGANSLTDIFPDQDSAALTKLDAVKFSPSQVRLEGQTIHLQGSGLQGAKVVAPNGEVFVRARTNPNENSTLIGPTSDPTPASAATVVMDKNTRIDVSGLRGIVDADGNGSAGGVPVAIERNSVRIELRGEQLADAPILRDSPIRSQPIYVDARIGTTLINRQTVNDAIASQTERGIFEKMATGGAVEISSTGSVVLLPGSTVALSGGSIAYSPGTVRTSRLFDGRDFYDVATAPNDRAYTQVFDVLKIPDKVGYVEGLAAGKLNIASRNLLLDGKLIGGAVVGTYQNANAPFRGSFTSIFTSKVIGTVDEFDRGLRHGLVFAENNTNGLGDFMKPGSENWQPLLDAQFGSNGQVKAQTVSPQMLVDSDMSSFTMSTNRGIQIATGNTLNFKPGTDLTLSGKLPIAVDRSVRSAAGKVSIVGDAGVKVADNVSLDVSGLWLNESGGGTKRTRAEIDSGEKTRSLTDGGTVSILGDTRSESPPSAVVFGSNTTVDTSSGVFVDSKGKVFGGKGGTFITGADAAVSQPTSLIGYGFTTGSTYGLSAREFGFGANAPLTSQSVDLDRLINLGFSSITLSSTFGNLTFSSGYQLAPSLTQYLLPVKAVQGEGDALRSQALLSKLDASRAAPLNLTFNANQEGVARQFPQSILVESGASLSLPVGSKLSMNGRIAVSVEGNLSTPGGEINLATNNLGPKFGYRPDAGIRIGNGATLDVAGVAVRKFGNTVANLGDVRAGGSVKLTAEGSSGTVQVDESAKIDISGTSATFDTAYLQGSTTRYKPTLVASDAGSLTVSAVQGGFLGGTVRAESGGLGKSYGKFTFQYTAPGVTNRTADAPPSFVSNPLLFPLGERQFVFSSAATAKPTGYSLFGDWDVLVNGARPISNPNLEPIRDAFFQRVSQWRISDTSIKDAGELNLLSGEVTRFSGVSSVSARESLRISSLAIRTEPNQKVTLSAPYVRLGNDAIATASVPQVTKTGLFGPDPTISNPPDPSKVDALRVNKLATSAVSNGELTVNSSRGLDLEANLVVQGAKQVTLTSQNDIRLVGGPELVDGYVQGSLSVAGNLSLIAARIFPITQTKYLLNAPDGDISFATPLSTVSSNVSNPPYSALGWLIGSARNIEQAGAVYAPFGQIDLIATQRVRFAPDSVTSVSGAGITIPLGTISNGVNWSVGNSTLRNPIKAISVSADTVLVDGATGSSKAARLDASGGGDIVATEFVRGPQGSTDLYSVAGSFAILPSYTAAFSPLVGGDRNVPVIAAGATIRIENGIAGLPAGVYKILPASYAQLDGAFLVRPTAATNLGSAIAGGDVSVSRSGVNSLVGYRGREAFGLTSQKPEWFDVLTAAQVRTLAEYRSNTASRFFDAEVASRAQDGGTVKLVAQKALEIIGTVNLTADAAAAASAQARRGTLEIAGGKVRVSSGTVAAADQNGTITVNQAKLEEIAAGDLHIGGSISGNKLLTEAKTVTVDAGVTLKAGTIILSANDSISLGAGSNVESSAQGARKISVEPRALEASRSSASSDSSGSTVIASVQPTVLTRSGTISTSGPQISVGQQAVVSGKSVVIDTTGGLSIDPSAQVLGTADTKIGTQTILLGAAPTGTPGFILTGNLLNALNQSTSISLQGYQKIVTYGNQALGSSATKRLRLDTPTLAAGSANTALVLTAERIDWLRSSAGATAPLGPTLAGTQLTINTTGNTASDGLRIGAGDKSIDGFANVAMNIGSGSEGSRLNFEGTSKLAIGGNLTAKVDQVQSSLLVDKTVTLADAAVNVSGTASFVKNTPQTPSEGTEGAGGKLTVTSVGAMVFDTAVKMPSGEVALTSTGGNLVVGPKAVINVAGYQKPIFDQRIELAGGKVSLNVENTNAKLTIADGAKIDVSAANNTAGSVEIRSAGTLDLGQTSSLQGSSKLDSRGGALLIDARQGVDLDRVAKASVDGGFTRSLDVRARTGDLVLSKDSTIKTETVVIAADDGKLDMAGNIDASSASGGKVELWQRGTTGQVLTIKDSARMNVAGQTGGEVTLGSTNAIVVAGKPEVSGGSADGRRAGTLTLRAPRTGTAPSGTGIAISQAAPGAAIQVVGRVETSLEGVRTANSTDPDLSFAKTLQSLTPATAIATDVAAYRANAQNILANAPVQSLGPVQLLAGIELLGAAGINLTTSTATLDFAASNIGLGSLTVRSNGNLTIAGSISDGLTSTATPATLARNSWSYRLVAGSDLSAANPLAVTKNLDTLTINPTRDVRTGTGSIGLASSGNVEFATSIGVTATSTTDIKSQPGSVYTVGRLAGPADGYVVAPGYFETAQKVAIASRVARTQGGSITVQAGGTVKGNDMQTNPSHWFLRQGAIDTVTGNYSIVAGWVPEVGGLAAPNSTTGSTLGFNMHLGSLGGGKLTVNAQGTESLYLANVSSGRMRSTTPDNSQLEVINRAPTVVTVAQKIVGGQFMSMDGELTLTAGKSIGENSSINAPILLQGNNAITVNAREAITVSQPYNSTTISRDSTTPTFSTFGDKSVLKLASVGEISVAQASSINTASTIASPAWGESFARLTTPNWLVQSASNVLVEFGGVASFLAPSDDRRFSLLAGHNVWSKGGIGSSVIASDIDPDAISYLRPNKAVDLSTGSVLLLNRALPTLTNSFRQPVRIYAGEGDVASAPKDAVTAGNANSVIRFQFPQSIWVKAGRDINQLALSAQNSSDADVTIVQAGRDVVNNVTSTVAPDGTQLVINDASIVVSGPGVALMQAGRDIRFGTVATGGVSAFSSVGNTRVAALPAKSASLVLIAGVKDQPAYDLVLDTYLKPDASGISFDQSRYVGLARQALEAAGKLVDANASVTTVWGSVQSLARPQRDQLARNIFFQELRIAGGADTGGILRDFVAPAQGTTVSERFSDSLVAFLTKKGDSAATGDTAWAKFQALPEVNQAEFVSQVALPKLLADKAITSTDPRVRDYGRGYKASAILFPTDGVGNIDLVYNKVNSLQGGSVQLLAPGTICREAPATCASAESTYKSDKSVGNVFVGLVNPPSSLKDSSKLGIFGLNGANVQGFAGNNVEVNNSRIVAGGGGDLLLWSSGGNIDAGRGSKAAVSVPPPVIKVKPDGTVTIDLSDAIQGSGIRAFSFNDKTPAGEVSLYAPKGTVDAGDAGIQGGNVSIGGLIILNADNIRLASDPNSGANIGVSTAPVSLAPAPTTGTSDAANKAVEAATSDKSKRVRIIVVDFDGFGVDCKATPLDPSCKPAASNNAASGE